MFLFLRINLVLSVRFEGSSGCVGKENFLFIFLGLEFFSFQIFLIFHGMFSFSLIWGYLCKLKGLGAADGEEKHLSVSWPPGRPVGGGLRLHKSDFAE